MRHILIVTEFMLVRRIETMMVASIVCKKDKLERVIKDTIETIEGREKSDVCDEDLNAYQKNIEMALYLSYLEVPDLVMQYLENAVDVIFRNLGKMTHTYIMAERMKSFDEDNIGTLAILPNDIISTIATMVV